MIDDQTYNRFSRALAEQIRERAKGLDSESARIVNTRPQEHVLSGFLTSRKARNPQLQDTDADEEDLPRDSPSSYERSGWNSSPKQKAWLA
jgi:hypothetical protein